MDRLAGATAGLVAGAAVAASLLVRDAVSRKRKVKLLEAGTLLLFGGLAAFSLVGRVNWSILGVRLCVDAGLLVIVLASLAIRRPFTLSTTHGKKVSPEHWSGPEFLRANDIITAVWAAAFCLIVAADLLMLYVPEVPLRIGVWVTVLAIFGAYRFTEWYPSRKR